MKQSKTMQNVMMRARGEALKAKLSVPQMEHIYLAILKVSQLTSERIAPSSSERDAIDAEIIELQQIFKRAGVDAKSAEVLLRPLLLHPGRQQNGEHESGFDILCKQVHIPPDGVITAPALLKVILDHPTSIISMANGERDIPPIEEDIWADEETQPANMPGPQKEQGREELSMGAGSNNVRSGGAETQHTDRSDGASFREASEHGGFVMPEMPDSSEFNVSSLTIFDVSDVREKEPEDSQPDLHDPNPTGERNGAESSSDEEHLEPEPAPLKKLEPNEETPEKKPSSSKREGIDLGAILMELRNKRESGEDALPEPQEEDSYEPDAKPAIVDEPEPEPEKEVPLEPEKPKERTDEGVDLLAIMRELREHRENSGDDDSDAEEPVSQNKHSPQNPTQGTAPPPPHNKPAREQKRASRETPQSKVKKTEFLGSTYSGGLAYAITIYTVAIVLTVGLFWGLSLILDRFYHPENVDPASYKWLFMVVYVTGCYFLLRIIPGLFGQRFKPFALFLDGLLFSAYVVYMTQTFLSTVAMQTQHGDVYIKIAAGIFVLGALIRANGKIRMLPDTRGITKETQYWVSKLTGSPDKIFYSGALITLFVPVIIGTVYWILNMQPHKSVLIYFFITGWFLLVFLPQSQTLWYSEYSYGNSNAQIKRKAACEGWMMQMILLFPIGMLMFLSLLYGWFPLPVWEIVLLSFFGLTYVIGTISTISNGK